MRFSRKLNFAPMATIVLLFVCLYVPYSSANKDLSDDDVKSLRKVFDMFDRGKKGSISFNMVSTILRTLRQTLEESELQTLIEKIDAERSGQVEFDEFLALTAMLVDDDAETIQEQLRKAFLLYDKEGNGYIKTSDLREVMRALDDKLTEDELDDLVAEIDFDGSGTVDFKEFKEWMSS